MRLFFAISILLVACGDDSSAIDASLADSAAPDAADGGGDAGSSDAGMDVASPDAAMDAGADALDASTFNPEALAWQDLTEPAAGPLMVWGALVAAIDDSRALLVGGTTASAVNNTVLGRTWLYTWTDGELVAEEIEGVGPDPRYCGCAIYDPARNVVVLGGGRNFAPEVTLTPETWELDVETRSWTRVEAMGTPIPGLGCNMAYVNGTTYWFGGANARLDLGPVGSSFQTWRYDPDVPEWVELEIEGPSPRYDAHFIPESDESVLLFGGAFRAMEGMQNDVWRFDGSSWTMVTEGGPDGRRVAWVVPAPGGFIVAGGFDADSNVLGDMWYWNDGAWTELALGAPERIAFPAVLPGGPGSLGIMMSGYDGDGPVRAIRELR